jgi:hypothetical protein
MTTPIGIGSGSTTAQQAKGQKQAAKMITTVAVVGLDTFVWLKEVRQTGGEDLDVGPRPGGVQALDPHQVAHQNVNA